MADPTWPGAHLINTARDGDPAALAALLSGSHPRFTHSLCATAWTPKTPPRQPYRQPASRAGVVAKEPAALLQQLPQRPLIQGGPP